MNQIEIPVSIWYMAQDRSVPPAMGRYMSAEVPDSEFHLIESAGHPRPLANLRETLGSIAEKATNR